VTYAALGLCSIHGDLAAESKVVQRISADWTSASFPFFETRAMEDVLADNS
jgi:hypothetical protein